MAQKQQQVNEITSIILTENLEETTTQSLLEAFNPIYRKVLEWKDKVGELVVTDESQTREMQLARTTRLALRDIRVDADKLRKRLKEDSLRYGRAVQGVYNMIEYMIKPLEEHLEYQEKFAERKREERRNTVREERMQRLEPYRAFTPSIAVDLADLEEVQFENLLKYAKHQMEEEAKRIEAERIEAKRRIAEAEETKKREAEERRRLEEENRRMREAMAERARKESEELAKLRKEQEEAVAEANRLRVEAEKSEAERREREAKEQMEAERIEAERRQKEEAMRLLGDKGILIQLCKDIESIERPQVESKEANDIVDGTMSLLAKTANYLRTKIND